MSEKTPPPPALLAWRVHPAARRPRAATIAASVIILFSVTAGVGFGHFGWSALSAAVLFLSLNRFFLPSSFVIDRSGLSARFPLSTRRMEWSAVRRFEPGSHDVVLSTSVRRTWLNAQRELRVPFGSEKARVLELVRSHLPADLTTESRRTRSEEESAEVREVER